MKRIILVMVFFLVIGIIPVHSYWGPRALMVENITGTYGAGDASAGPSISSTRNSVGYVDVYVPNTDDVLQYVRLNVSSSATTRTDIRNWNGSLTAYRDYAMSNPTLTTATRMYLNTTAGNQQQTYIPVYDYAPSLNISMSVTNVRGGDDLYSEKDILGNINILQFNFTIFNPSSTKDLVGTNITYNITFDPDTPASNSSVTILSSTVSATSGAVWTRTRGPYSNDAIEWQGTLAAGAQVDIIFNASTLGGDNYNGNFVDLNAGTYGANAIYLNNTHVITELTFTGAFTRGPIREGIDLKEATPWNVKTYVRNMANDSVASGENELTYRISSWRIYNVTPSTGDIDALISFNDALNQDLTANTQFKIPSWIPIPGSITSKPYIAPYFDWYVHWNDTNVYTYNGKINFSMTLPTLHEIDNTPDKSSPDTFSPELYGNKLLGFNVTAQHSGSTNSQVQVGKLQIHSVIPYTDITDSGYANMSVDASSREVYFYDSDTTTTYNMTVDGSNIQITITDSTTSANGSIVLDIADLSTATIFGAGALGMNMTNGDQVILSYDVWTYENSTGSLTSGIDNGETFEFDGNQTLWTQSYTYMVINNTYSRTASENSLSAYKQMISTDPTNPQLVNVTFDLSVIGTIDNIKFIDYIPTGMSNYSVVMMSGSEGTAFNRTKLGTVTTSDGFSMDAWEITHPSSPDGWDVSSNGNMQFTYLLNLSTPGLYILPVQIAAFDPSVDQGISLTRYGSIKFIVPEKMRPLVIDEDDDLQLLGSVIVGKPVSHRKSFNVYNPNSKPVRSQFKTEIFMDTVASYVSYYDDYGKKIEESVDSDIIDNKKYLFWESTLNPQESRSYELRVLTPPAAEVDRDIEVIEKLENKHVKLRADIVIKNFAQEPYTNLKMNLNIPKDNIFELKDAFGKPLSYTGDESSTTVTIQRLDANTVMSLSILYKQSYPTIIITPDRTRYDSGEISNLEILIINGGEKLEHPSIETEVFTEDMELIYADIMRLEKSLKPLETTDISTKFLLPMNAPTGRYIANVRFSEDSIPITDSSINFYVLGMKGDPSSNIKVFILVILGAILIYFTYKRLVRVSNK